MPQKHANESIILTLVSTLMHRSCNLRCCGIISIWRSDAVHIITPRASRSEHRTLPILGTSGVDTRRWRQRLHVHPQANYFLPVDDALITYCDHLDHTSWLPLSQQESHHIHAGSDHDKIMFTVIRRGTSSRWDINQRDILRKPCWFDSDTSHSIAQRHAHPCDLER